MMPENAPRRDAFVLATYEQDPASCAVEVRFDMEQGREIFLAVFEHAARRRAGDVSVLDFLRQDPKLDARRIMVELRPFGPFYPVADDACAGNGISAKRSREIVAICRFRRSVSRGITPAPRTRKSTSSTTCLTRRLKSARWSAKYKRSIEL